MEIVRRNVILILEAFFYVNNHKTVRGPDMKILKVGKVF